MEMNIDYSDPLPLGMPNKTTAELREAALEGVGGVAYLEQFSRTHPVATMTMVRLLGMGNSGLNVDLATFIFHVPTLELVCAATMPATADATTTTTPRVTSLRSACMRAGKQTGRRSV